MLFCWTYTHWPSRTWLRNKREGWQRYRIRHGWQLLRTRLTLETSRNTLANDQRINGKLIQCKVHECIPTSVVVIYTTSQALEIASLKSVLELTVVFLSVYAHFHVLRNRSLQITNIFDDMPNYQFNFLHKMNVIYNGSSHTMCLSVCMVSLPN